MLQGLQPNLQVCSQGRRPAVPPLGRSAFHWAASINDAPVLNRLAQRACDLPDGLATLRHALASATASDKRPSELCSRMEVGVWLERLAIASDAELEQQFGRGEVARPSRALPPPAAPPSLPPAVAPAVPVTPSRPACACVCVCVAGGLPLEGGGKGEEAAEVRAAEA